MNIGYACINNTLKQENITTNRGMVKKTFQEKGLEYASELALKNTEDLYKIVKWNCENNIKVFRMSSDLFPWMSEYEITDLNDWVKINDILLNIGNLAIQTNMRLSFHPGQFNILCSPKESVVKNTIKELNQHAFILDSMGLPCNQTHKINIHIGGVYGDKQSAISKWIENFNLLSDSTKSRLTIENDDKPSMYTVEDLLYVSEKTKTPIVFDFHHHDCHPGNLSKEEALYEAINTWPNDIIPITHFSSSRKIYEDSTVKNVSHADYIYEEIPFSNKYKFDVVLEAKAKELALIKYLNEYK